MTGPGRLRGTGGGRLAALIPSGTSTAARTPFVLLVVVLLGSGLITLLLLNSALNQGSFELSRLEKRTTELTDEQQALQQEVDGYSAPGALEKRARELGMVPGGTPAFLNPDGTVRGVPSEATGQPALMGARQSLPPALSGTPTPSGTPSDAPSGSPAGTASPRSVPTASGG
ncbi:septum formation initiator family protein [Streptomyces niger]|uniref:septum formation initiator family protein n=1 Tax=Streptomyces niger TaxID=66373 RepID=UPI000699C3E4|nr:septum formation initiator family protein [Streptomyces niger]